MAAATAFWASSPTPASGSIQGALGLGAARPVRHLTRYRASFTSTFPLPSASNATVGAALPVNRLCNTMPTSFTVSCPSPSASP